MQTDAEQSIADGFAALSAGRPQAALDAVDVVDADLHPRASLLRGHAQKALGSHESAEHAYRALTDSTDAHQCATGWWSLAALKTAAFTHTDASRLDALLPDFAEDGYRGLCRRDSQKRGVADVTDAHAPVKGQPGKGT